MSSTCKFRRKPVQKTLFVINEEFNRPSMEIKVFVVIEDNRKSMRIGVENQYKFTMKTLFDDIKNSRHSKYSDH